jgi:hypothetical protein
MRLLNSPLTFAASAAVVAAYLAWTLASWMTP